MTKEELWKNIEKLSELRSNYSCFEEDEEPFYRALSLGIKTIKALEQQSEDCVSRQSVEKITWEEPSYNDALNVLTEVRDKVRALPPVVPTFPKSVTNGDIVKTMFPNIESRLDENTGIILVKWADGTTKTFKASWWNALYKRGAEND